MPLRQGETIPQMVTRIAREQGLDARATKIALSIVAQESGFNPNAEGDWSDTKKRMRSIGLFQLNEEGLGSGMGDTRYDPEANANRGIKNLKAVYDKHGALTDGDIAYLAQRPANKAEYVGSINAKTSGQDQQWAATISNAATRGGGGPVFPVAGQTLNNTKVTTEHGAKGTNSGYAGVPESHRGTDFHAKRGTAALATTDGVVTTAHQWDGTKNDPYGNYIDVKGNDGKTYRYSHLENLNVKQGTRVGAGTTIGTIDSTGNSTGDHLHFEVIEPNGQTSDPKAYLSNAQSGSGGRAMPDTSEANAIVKRLESQSAQLKAAAEASANDLKTKTERAQVLNAEIARIKQLPRKTPADNAQSARAQAELDQIEDGLEYAREKAKEDAALVRAQELAIANAEKAAAGQELDSTQRTENEAQAELARAQAAKLTKEAAQSGDPNSPENQGKLAQAALWRKQAENYDAITKADNNLKAAQAGAAQGSANQANAQADYIRGTLESTVRQHLAAAGLNDAQAKVALGKLQPEINNIVAQTSKIKDDAAYTRALTQAINQKLPVEIAKMKGELKLTDAQANDLSSLLPGKMILQGTQARLDQAQAEAQRSSGIANLATARKTEFDMQMEAWKAERQNALTKLMGNPNVTSDDISGFLLASATNAGEMINAFNSEVDRRSKEESARNLRVREGIDIQNADEAMRNNLANNITNYMEARTGQQNASTAAVGPTLGAARVANTLAGLGPLMGEGDAGIRGIASSMGVGASVLNGVLSGLKEYQTTIKGFKDQMPTVRMADPNKAAPNFVSPGLARGVQQGSAGIGSLPAPPKAPAAVVPNTVQQDEAAVVPPPAAAATEPVAGNTPPEQMDDTGNDLPQQPVTEPGPDVHEEEEEEGQGGGGVFTFKPPRATKAKKMSRAARAIGNTPGFTPPGSRRAA